MIGEGAPSTSTSTSTTPTSSPAPAEPSAKAGDGNSHVVARGETLTSIAKMHNVSVSDLQKSNHIDNPLKLQAGQTLLIPPSPIPSPSSSVEGFNGVSLQPTLVFSQTSGQFHFRTDIV